MDFLLKINLSAPQTVLEEYELAFSIGKVTIFSKKCKTELVDVCGYLLSESDLACVLKPEHGKIVFCPCSRDDLRACLLQMNATSPLKPTEESSSALYKTLSGIKKKKQKGKRDEEDDDEDDDEEVLRIIRRKDVKANSSKKIVKEEKEEEKEEEDEDEDDEEEDEEEEEEEDENELENED
jgi:hypothetical protein